MNWVNAVIQGILVGGLYGMFATGLSIAFGVMRMVNLAHGDVAVTFAFLATTIVLAADANGYVLNPFVTLIVLIPVAFVAGFLMQKAMYDRLVGVEPAYQVVATFGLSVVLQNVLLQRYSANVRSLNIGSLGTKSFTLGDIAIGYFPLLRFIVGVAVLVALSLFLGRTKMGRAFRATSDDPAAAGLMGIDTKLVYGVALGLAFATVAIAGVFNGAQTNFSAASGPELLIFAFEAVIIGGLGSLWGTLAGGIVLGVAQTVGAQFVPGWKQLIGHIVFLAVLAVRPNGLFGKEA
jgi:branched-chain amino acid transport system permease protein